MPRPIRVGVQLAPQHAEYAQIRDAVRRVEDLGVDAVFNWDHFFPLTGDPDGRHYEAWTTIAAWAEQTSRIELGTLVNCNSYRGADLQADMARTIDHISGGRFIFGTGAGWFERDYDEYGYEFGRPGTRLDALALDLPRIEARWATLNPPPTRDIPVLIGGGGEQKTLRIVAKHADIWHGFADVDVMAHKLSVLRAHCAEIGRDFSEIELSTGTSIRGMGAGTPELWDAHRALGVSLFVIALDGPDYDLAPVQRLIDWREAQTP